MLGNVLAGWVEACERHPRAVLGVITLSAVLVAVYVVQNFAIDSDLGKLIRPSAHLTWYEANERYKALFPELQQTSIVVVSGPEAAAVDRTAGRLVASFRENG
ncbi:MAG: hypothetical protein PVH91_06300, partial [Pseudomonadales bacterium]